MNRFMHTVYNFRRIFIGSAVALVLSAFFIPNFADADLSLPSTSCDSELTRLETFFPIVSGIAQEGGTKAFKYGTDNNSFVSFADNVLTINIDLLFEPNNSGGQDASFIKFNGLSAICSAVYGGPITQLNTGLNTIEFNTNTYELTANGSSLGVITTTGLIRYVWVDVADSYPAANAKSYSYLVDIMNLQNPTGSVPDDEGEEEGEGGGNGDPDEEPVEDSEEESEPTGKRPVLIIPGIMGTELFRNGELVWFDISQALVGNTNFLQELILDIEGNSINNIEIGDIVKTAPMNTDIFSSLLNSLETSGYVPQESLFYFSYDWRINLDQNIELLESKINSIKLLSGYEKIDMIAHSMGGLLTKNYINQVGSESLNRLVFVGTPHLGAPKTFKTLLTGDNFSIPWLAASAIEALVLNFPSVYQLLPNPKYFEEFQGYIKNSGNNFYDYTTTEQFLLSKNLNETMLTQANSFFDKQLYDMGFLGVETYALVGCGKATQSAYTLNSSNTYINWIGYSSGDGTVPMVSAQYLNVPNANKFYIKGGSHAELPSITESRNLIVNLLNGQTYSHANVSNSNSFCNFKGKKLTWRSPVEVHIYDSLGNHVGPTEHGIELGIPGVDYEIIDGEKFIFLPEGQEYTIEAIGEETGSFDLLISKIDNGEVLNTILYNDVQVQANSRVRFIISDLSNDQTIQFDFNNNGSFEELNYSIAFTGENEPEETTEEDTPQLSGGSGGGYYVPTEQPRGEVLGESVLYFDNITGGELILDSTDNRTVYMVIGNKKYGFTSELVFLNMGFSYANVKVGNLSGFEAGEPIENSDAHPEGSLIQQGKTIWLLKDGKRYGFPSMEVLNSYNIKLINIIPANQLDLNLPEEVLPRKI